MDTQLKHLSRKLAQTEKDLQDLTLIVRTLIQVLVAEEVLHYDGVKEWPVWATSK
jgi:hypothetical protein